MRGLKIEISPKTIVSVFFFLVFAYVLYTVRDVLVMLFLAVIFSSAMAPTIDRLERKRVPKSLAIFGIYLFVLAVIVVAFSLVIPPLVNQTTVLLSQVRLPELPTSLDFEQIKNGILNYESLLSRIGNTIPTIFSAVIGTFSGILIVFTLLVMTYYVAMERKHIHKHLAWMFGGEKAEVKSEKFFNRLEVKLGGWVRGELTLMLVIGTMTYIGLSLLGIPFALPLALLAGVLEVIPNIGPTIAAIPAIVIAFLTGSPAIGGVTLLLYILIQQLENNLIVPKVMSAAVGIHPLITIVVLLIGLRVGGVMGMVLGVPTFIIFRTILDEYYDGKNPLQSHTE